MTWTYNSTLIASSDKDFVRWRLGLTSSGEQLQSDEEINGALAVYPSKFDAAAAVAMAVAGVFSKRADMTMGKLSIKHSQKALAFRKLSEEIAAEAADVDAPTPWAAAHSHDRKEAVEENEDRVSPFFGRGMHDPPGTYPGIDQNTTGI